MDKYKELRDATATISALLAEHYEINEMLSMIENGEWAEHAGQTELGSKVESTLTSLLNEIRQLQAERDELLKDKKRLDYIVNGDWFCCVEANGECWIFEVELPDEYWNISTGRSYREAIDNAIATESEHA